MLVKMAYLVIKFITMKMPPLYAPQKIVRFKSRQKFNFKSKKET